MYILTFCSQNTGSLSVFSRLQIWVKIWSFLPHWFCQCLRHSHITQSQSQSFYFLIISFTGALAYAELGTLVPKSGAEYVYLFETVGPIPAFLFAWTSTLILKPAQVSIIALGFGAYVVQPFFPNECEPPQLAVKLFATLSICKSHFISLHNF